MVAQSVLIKPCISFNRRLTRIHLVLISHPYRLTADYHDSLNERISQINRHSKSRLRRLQKAAPQVRCGETLVFALQRGGASMLL